MPVLSSVLLALVVLGNLEQAFAKRYTTSSVKRLGPGEEGLEHLSDAPEDDLNNHDTQVVMQSAVMQMTAVETRNDDFLQVPRTNTSVAGVNIQPPSSSTDDGWWSRIVKAGMNLGKYENDHANSLVPLEGNSVVPKVPNDASASGEVQTKAGKLPDQGGSDKGVSDQVVLTKTPSTTIQVGSTGDLSKTSGQEKSGQEKSGGHTHSENPFMTGPGGQRVNWNLLLLVLIAIVAAAFAIHKFIRWYMYQSQGHDSSRAESRRVSWGVGAGDGGQRWKGRVPFTNSVSGKFKSVMKAIDHEKRASSASSASWHTASSASKGSQLRASLKEASQIQAEERASRTKIEKDLPKQEPLSDDSDEEDIHEDSRKSTTFRSVGDVMEDRSIDRVFEITQSEGQRKHFKWVTYKEAQKSPSLDPCTHALHASSCEDHARYLISAGGSADMIPAPWSVESLSKILKDRSVDTHSWSDSKMPKLVSELNSCKAFIVVTSDGLPKRIMERVLVIVYNPATGQVIVPDPSSMGGGSTNTRSFQKQLKKQASGVLEREAKEKTLGIRRLRNERIEQTAQRCIKEKLDLSDAVIQPDLKGKIKTLESEEMSDFFYPGLTSVVCRHLIQAKVVATDAKVLKSIAADVGHVGDAFFESEKNGEIMRWNWKSIESVAELRQHRTWFSSAPASRTSRMNKYARQGATGKRTRSSLTAMRDTDLTVLEPWDESAVQKLLEEHSVAPEEFGMSLQQLSLQASQGNLIFAKHDVDGLVAITDYLQLRVFEPGCRALLAQAKSSEGDELQLPEVIWRLDEGSWDAARRLARSALLFEEDALAIDSDLREVKQLQEKIAPRMIKRKWLLSAEINEGIEYLVAKLPCAFLSSYDED